MFILSAAAVIGGLYLLVDTAISKREVALALCFGPALIAAGLVYFLAARRRYRGHWAFVLGVALIGISFLGLGSEIDDALAGSSNEDAWLKVCIIIGFAVFGSLSLWSGHRLHRCSVELERLNCGE